jgi:hypothetical protein
MRALLHSAFRSDDQAGVSGTLAGKTLSDQAPLVIKAVVCYSIRVALYSETSQNGAEMSSKKLPVSLFAATQVATHPSISSSDDQDMRGRVRCGLPNAC